MIDEQILENQMKLEGYKLCIKCSREWTKGLICKTCRNDRGNYNYNILQNKPI